MTALATANIFRDMSGRAEVADLLKTLSDNSVAIAQAGQKASTPATGGSSGGGSGSSVGRDNPPSNTTGGTATPKAAIKPTAGELHDDLQILRNAEMNGDITPELRRDLATSHLQNAFKVDSVNVQQLNPHDRLRPWWVTAPLPDADDLPALLADAKALLDAQLQEIASLFVPVSRTTLASDVKLAVAINRVRLAALARRMNSTRTLLGRDWAAAGKSAADVLTAKKATDALEFASLNIEMLDFEMVAQEAHIFDPSAKQRLVTTPLTGRTNAEGNIISAYLKANP